MLRLPVEASLCKTEGRWQWMTPTSNLVGQMPHPPVEVGAAEGSVLRPIRPRGQKIVGPNVLGLHPANVPPVFMKKDTAIRWLSL